MLHVLWGLIITVKRGHTIAIRKDEILNIFRRHKITSSHAYELEVDIVDDQLRQSMSGTSVEDSGQAFTCQAKESRGDITCRNMEYTVNYIATLLESGWHKSMWCGGKIHFM